MSPVFTYTVLRLLLFVTAVGVLSLLGVRGLPLLLLAVLVSGMVSLVLLSRQRDAMSGAVLGRYRGVRRRLDARTRAEDEADDVRRLLEEERRGTPEAERQDRRDRGESPGRPTQGSNDHPPSC